MRWRNLNTSINTYKYTVRDKENPRRAIRYIRRALRKKKRKKYNARKYVLALLCVWMVLRLHGDRSSCYCVCVCTYFMRGCIRVHVLFSIAFIHPQVHCIIDIFIYTARTRFPNNYNYVHPSCATASPPARLSFLLSNNYKSLK